VKIMRTALTSGSWVEGAATLAAAILMTVAGLAALHDVPATAVVTVSAPIRIPDAVGQDEAPQHVAMPHVDISRG
jgi:hypothetical protein